jgi:hypothetical protein
MKALAPFSMRVVDVFRFADGRSVFIGPVEGDVKFIRPCKCELLVDSVLSSFIQIEGEMMTDPASPEGYRSVYTRDIVSLDRRLLTTSDCLLRPLS